MDRKLARFLRIPAVDTLVVQLTLPLAGRVEDFHLQVSAPAGCTKKEQSHEALPLVAAG